MKNHIEGILQTQTLAVEDYLPTIDWKTVAIQFQQQDFILIQQPKSKRLGHYVESIFVQLLKLEIQKGQVFSNIQIQEEKNTLGELDILIHRDNTLEHIEFCYKFYLFDPSLGEEEDTCWIGPNRNDSLLLKIKKLKEKQLPLLHHDATQAQLKVLLPEIDNLGLTQKVCFLGQLYVPYNDWKAGCVFQLGKPTGCYIRTSEIDYFQDCQWYITTSKLDWLETDCSVDIWITTTELLSEISAAANNWPNPICWMKDREGVISKCFVVNWE